ncbi:MAG: hypothetical protein JWM80_259 [Cyanobacteria bacterium RYN_339]|nr:hypothetical protein [Cyanobacteria bacterium RYN_339]
MSRILWFTLGALAGTAYASRVINKERLDLAVGESRPVEQAKGAIDDYKTQLRGYQAQLADMVDQRARTMGTMVTERGHLVAEQIRSVTFLEETPTAEVVSTPMPQVIGGRDDLAM